MFVGCTDIQNVRLPPLTRSVRVEMEIMKKHGHYNTLDPAGEVYYRGPIVREVYIILTKVI